MPATYIKSYKYVAPDGSQFDTLTEEQIHEVNGLFSAPIPAEPIGLATWIVNQRKALMPILAQRERKRQSPAKPKRGRKATTPEPATV